MCHMKNLIYGLLGKNGSNRVVNYNIVIRFYFIF